MLEKERLIKELLKNGYSKKDETKSWDISKREFRYLNKDMAKSFLRLTEHPRYKATITDIEIDLRNSKYQRNIILLLGSLISSFDINDYLFKVSQSMFPGDYLVIGNGIRKGERFTKLETYKHPLFNDWLIHLMRLLDFK